MPSEITTKGIPHKKLQPILERIKKLVFSHDIVKDMCEEYDIEEEELNLWPICFAEVPVSARTDHGVIYININLLDDIDQSNISDKELEDKIAHYLTHELTHVCQQTTGDKPTPGSDSGSYLDNPVEQEAFRNQTKYISDTQSDEEAKRYVEELLEHHSEDEDEDESDDKKINKRRKKLLELAMEVGLDINKIAG